MNNEQIPASQSKEERDAAREARKKIAQELRNTSNRVELIQSIRSIFKKVQEENPILHFEKVLGEGTLDEMRNMVLDIKRFLDIDGKMKRLSALTVVSGNNFLKVTIPLLETKKQLDRLQNELKQYRSAEKRDNLSPQEKTELRKLVMQMRQTVQNYNLIGSQTIKLFSIYTQNRRKDMGEEAALRHSTVYYLQFVDAPQRARIEIQMKEKMGDMPQERRIEALKLFIQMLVQISPSVRDAEVGRCIEMAHLFLEENHVDDALRELEKALEYEESAEVYLELAACWKMKNDRNKEETYLKKAIHCDPDELEPYIRMAQLYENEGKEAAAIPIYEKIIDLRPGHFPTLTHAARLAFDYKRWAFAIQWLTQILKQKPKSKKTLMRLGIALIQTGQIERGLSLLQECQRLGMENGQLDLFLGIAYRSQGYHTDAQAAFQAAAHLLPKDPEVVFWLALTEFESGEYEKAEEHCRFLLSQNPQNISAVIMLARTLNRLGESRQSTELLAPYVKKPQIIFGALLEYGIGCLKENQCEEAYQVFKKVVDREPENQEARDLLGQACIQSGRLDEALLYIAPSSIE